MVDAWRRTIVGLLWRASRWGPPALQVRPPALQVRPPALQVRPQPRAKAKAKPLVHGPRVQGPRRVRAGAAAGRVPIEHRPLTVPSGIRAATWYPPICAALQYQPQRAGGLLHRGQALALCCIALTVGAADKLPGILIDARVEGPAGSGRRRSHQVTGGECCVHGRSLGYIPRFLSRLLVSRLLGSGRALRRVRRGSKDAVYLCIGTPLLVRCLRAVRRGCT
eukprot:scaffold83211_cov63-Phaeocystis_antarctica.AAC.2